MKAKEYIEAYRGDETAAAQALSVEFQALRAKRNIKTKEGWQRLYDEFVQKAAIIQEKLGFKPGFFKMECDL